MQLSTRALCSKRYPTRLVQMALLMLALTLNAAGVALVVMAAPAVAGILSDAQARYQKDRAACMSGESHQDRTTCLREAGAALQEAKRGRLDDGGARQYEQNRVMRCNAQPPEDREDCLRRMHGEGVTTGSVEEGGVYRELVRRVPAP